MKKTILWIIGIVGGIMLLAALILPWFFVGFGYRMRPYSGMMGRGFGFFHPLAWVGMVLGWLFCLAVLVLLGLGITSLVKYLTESRSHSDSTALPQPERTCPNCGRPAQPEWKTCPFCGTNLAEGQ